jgi:hypothetical protein
MRAIPTGMSLRGRDRSRETARVLYLFSILPFNPACCACLRRKILFGLLEKLSSRAAANERAYRALVMQKFRRCRECCVLSDDAISTIPADSTGP